MSINKLHIAHVEHTKCHITALAFHDAMVSLSWDFNNLKVLLSVSVGAFEKHI